jgi:hypothetical protein
MKMIGLIYPGKRLPAVEEVVSLLQDKERYQKLSRAAYDHWARHTLYKDDFCAAANELSSLKDGQ